MIAPNRNRRQKLPAVVRAFLGAEDGVAAVEFAIMLPTIVVMLLGLFSFGVAVYEKMEVSNATNAGAHLALINPSATDADIANAVVAATNLPITTANVTVTRFCECQNKASVPCGTTCGDGSYNRYFVTVAVSAPATLLFWSGAITLADNATTRIK